MSYVTRTPLSSQKVKGQLVAGVLNSQHEGTGATWRINAKMLSTCRGGGILCRLKYSTACLYSVYCLTNLVNKDFDFD